MKNHKADILLTAGLAVLTAGIFQRNCSADIIHLKNGRVMEGQVRRTDQGLWIEGALFTEEEIEKIEKGPAPSRKAGDKPWYGDILQKMGIKEPQTTPASPKSSAPVKPPPLKSGQTPPAGLPQSVPQGLLGVPSLVPGSGMDFSAVLDQAQRVQDEAYRRQMMMQQEIQRIESEGESYGDPGVSLPQGTYDQQKLLESYEDYQRTSGYPSGKTDVVGDLLRPPRRVPSSFQTTGSFVFRPGCDRRLHSADVHPGGCSGGRLFVFEYHQCLQVHRPHIF